MKKKVCVVSLGCPKNLVDAEMMLGTLKKDGFELSTDPADSDVIVVNTCGFIEEARRESIEKILEMSRHKETGRCQKLVVSGCLSQRYKDELVREIPEVDLFLGAAQILPDPDLPRIQSTPAHYSYVKISEGCSHSCSFCTIPAIRGGLRSRPIDSIVREVRNEVGRGVKEFDLIAQDLNEYGRDLKDGTNLTKLLAGLDRIDGDFWIRLLYMYPLEFNDRLIGTIRDAAHIVKYVDIPLQHISERILLSMKRGSPSRYVRQLLGKLKKQIPGIALRTTFLVGYPGETEGEFRELCNFVAVTEFDRVGVFKFSKEEGTATAKMTHQVSEEKKEERFRRLMKIQQGISLKRNRALIGKRVRLLCEGDGIGRMATQAPEIDGTTSLVGKNLVAGRFVEGEIVEAGLYDLKARVLTAHVPLDSPAATAGRKRSVSRGSGRRSNRN